MSAGWIETQEALSDKVSGLRHMIDYFSRIGVNLRWFADLSRADFLRSVGLYVMPDRLFLVRMRKSLFRLSLLEQEVREVPPGKDGASRREALSEAIRSLLPHFDPVKDPFYICLSPDLAIGCRLFLPQVAEENLPKVLEYEIGRHIPFRREDVYYDFLPMGRKGDKIALFLFAVPKKVLNDVLEALSSCGVKPRGVENTATAISNYLFFCTGGITGPSLVLGGHNHGWEMIGLNEGTNGWRRQKPELLFTQWMPQAQWVEGLGRELFHSCLSGSPKFFSWGYIADFLISVKEGPLQIEELASLGRKKIGDKELAHPFFLPALGAALRGLREATFSVNLLPGAAEKKEGKMLSWLNAGLAALLLMGLIAWSGSYPVKDEIRLRQFLKENERLSPSVEALRRQEEELDRLRNEVSFLAKLSERKGEVIRVMDELSRIIPNNAYLSGLRYRDVGVELQGSAESASNLVPLLERSPVFENVAFNAPSNRGRDNRETFSLKADLERPKEKAAKP